MTCKTTHLWCVAYLQYNLNEMDGWQTKHTVEEVKCQTHQDFYVKLIFVWRHNLTQSNHSKSV